MKRLKEESKYERLTGRKRDFTKFEDFHHAFVMLGEDHHNPVGSWVSKDELPFTVGWGTHWELAVWKHSNGKLSDKEREVFLDVVAESCFVYRVMMSARYWWRPSYSCGPQFGEYDRQETLYSEFAKIARKQSKKYKELLGEVD